MRKCLFALPLLMAASPAMAEPDAPRIELPAEIFSPENAEKMSRMLGVLTDGLMDLKVGELEAMAAGREPTQADRNRRLRDVVPGDAATVRRQIDNARPMMEQGMKAMARTLPVLIETMGTMAEELEGDIDRTTANVPQPGYPKR